MCELCLPSGLLSRRTVLKTAAGVPILLALAGRPSPALGQTVAVGPNLSIHPRSDWAGSDRPSAGPMESEEVRFLLVHHTAGTNSYAADSVLGQIRGMYDFHTGSEKGWPDIAYNFLIDRYGGVWEAREGSLDGPVRGDATGGNQGFSQLVSLMGDFRAEAPTAEALASLRAVLAWLADRHGLDTTPGATTTFTSRGSNRHASGITVETAVINGHRSMSQTSCPGEVLFGYVNGELMADVTSLRSGSPVTESSEATSTTSTTQAAAPPTTVATTAPTTVPTTAPTTAPGSSPSSQVDTVNDVASQSSLVASDILPSPTSDGGRLSAWQGLGLAGVGATAAAVGLLAIKRRGLANNSEIENDLEAS